MSEDKRWLHGPGLVEWLMPWIDHASLHPNFQRRINDWKAGSNASLYVVDELLVAAAQELSLWDIPDDLWVKRSRGRHPDEVKNEAVRRVEEDGESPATVARSIGADPKTVRIWVGRRAEVVLVTPDLVEQKGHRLSKKHRRVVELLAEGLPAAEVAEKANVTATNVHQIKSRFLRLEEVA